MYLVCRTSRISVAQLASTILLEMCFCATSAPYLMTIVPVCLFIWRNYCTLTFPIPLSGCSSVHPSICSAMYLNVRFFHQPMVDVVNTCKNSGNPLFLHFLWLGKSFGSCLDILEEVRGRLQSIKGSLEAQGQHKCLTEREWRNSLHIAVLPICLYWLHPTG